MIAPSHVIEQHCVVDTQSWITYMTFSDLWWNEQRLAWHTYVNIENEAGTRPHVAGDDHCERKPVNSRLLF